MSMQLTHAGAPAVAAGRAATLASNGLVDGARHVGSFVWRLLEAHGRRRASRELRERALPLQLLQPRRARELRAAVRFLMSD
jgi:hypothetical protein